MKNLAVTQHMLALISAAAGGPIDPNTISVFETIAYDTAPLKKSGSIFHGAVATPGLLAEMAASVNSGDYVPLHTLHLAGQELPVGKVFFASVLDNQLRAQFYVLNDQKELVAALNSGVIDSVSIGELSKHLTCSACQWDYCGPEASFMNFMDQTCGNGHTIGKDGAHLICDGLDCWMELSLVSRGAAPGAKIVGRAKARLNQDTQARLAATGVPADAMILIASHPVSKDDPMDAAALARLEAQAIEIARLTPANAALVAAAAEHATALAAANTARDAALAQFTSADAARVVAVDALAASSAVVTSVTAFLDLQCRAALTATGKPITTAIPETVEAKLALLSECKTNLVNLMAAGGHSVAACHEHSAATGAPPSAFTPRKLT